MLPSVNSESTQPGLLTSLTASPAPTKYTWFVLGITITAQTVGSVVSQGVYTMVPFFREEFHLTQANAALAVTVMNGGQILSMFGLGRMIDQRGERFVVSSMMVGMGLMAVAGSILATTFQTLLLALFALGMFYASVQPGGTRAIISWFPPNHRGLATGLRQAAVPLGTSIAALLLPWLAVSEGWRSAVLWQGVIGIAGGLFFWVFYRDGDLANKKKTPPMPVRVLLQELHQDRSFWLVLAAGVSMSAYQFTFTARAISFMHDHFGITLLAAASLFAVVQVLGIPGRVFLPFLSDRLWSGRRERSLGWIMAISVVATIIYMLLPKNTPTWVLEMCLAVLGIFGVGWFPLYVLQIAEMAPKAAIASTVSLATTICMIAMAVVPYLFGVVVGLAGYSAAWSLLVLPAAVVAVPLMRLPARSS